MVIDGMGHDLPRDLWPTFAQAIDHNAHRAGRPVPGAGEERDPGRSSVPALKSAD